MGKLLSGIINTDQGLVGETKEGGKIALGAPGAKYFRITLKGHHKDPKKALKDSYDRQMDQILNTPWHIHLGDSSKTENTIIQSYNIYPERK